MSHKTNLMLSHRIPLFRYVKTFPLLYYTGSSSGQCACKVVILCVTKTYG